MGKAGTRKNKRKQRPVRESSQTQSSWSMPEGITYTVRSSQHDERKRAFDMGLTVEPLKRKRNQ
jgi:hypothetical protein